MDTPKITSDRITTKTALINEGDRYDHYAVDLCVDGKVVFTQYWVEDNDFPECSTKQPTLSDLYNDWIKSFK